jgi:hypothetical protein
VASLGRETETTKYDLLFMNLSIGGCPKWAVRVWLSLSKLAPSNPLSLPLAVLL